MRVRASFAVPLLLLALFLARIVSTYAVFSDTYDEHHHIYWGIDWLERGVLLFRQPEERQQVPPPGQPSQMFTTTE